MSSAPDTTRATSAWLDVWTRFRPGAEAIYDVGTGRRWTYAALRNDSRAWAARLQQAGVGHGDRVAVLALNRGETICLLFACAELGAILFPMNWRLAAAELIWQVGDCRPLVAFYDEANAALAAQLQRSEPLTRWVALEQGPDARVEDLQPVPGPSLGDTWQLMYTSGSTGRPKGALITHRQAHWNALNTVLACDLLPSHSTLTFAPLFHTGGMNCLTTPLLHRGGRVVLTPKLDATQAIELIETERISHLMGVPTIYQLLADHPRFAGADLGCVVDALCGGAPLGSALLERYLDRGIPLRQGFGLTEVGPNCFSTPPDQVRLKLGTVGLPIHHVGARLVRPDGSDCAVGEPGELLLSGPAVCGGYWNRPDATADAIDDGWFHTGDVLSRDADGYFTVRGRIKEMFISGGENVYPAEIEAALGALDGVAACAVVGVPDERWGEVGRAFVEARPDTTLDPDSVRRFLGERLARFKVPKQVVLLQPLPRTGSGKIDKNALQALA